MKKKKIRKSIINILEKDLLKNGYNVTKHNWGPDDMGDKSEWLDIHGEIDMEQNIQHTIHLYFKDGKELTDVQIWKTPVKVDDDNAKQIFKK
jgi:hypothetical protein